MKTAVAAVDAPPVEFPATYMIIRGADMMDLAGAVNRAMLRGWVPTGGLIYVPMDPIAHIANPGAVQGEHLPYWQALVREATTE